MIVTHVKLYFAEYDLKKSHTNETNVEAFLSCRDYSNLVCTGLFNSFSL